MVLMRALIWRGATITPQLEETRVMLHGRC
jgi:hypothetical protein